MSSGRLEGIGRRKSVGGKYPAEGMNGCVKSGSVIMTGNTVSRPISVYKPSWAHSCLFCFSSFSSPPLSFLAYTKQFNRK